ncbi:MAG: electron-transfer flavoprotein:ubiquinone oxidoreductase, partial [Gammaproteobacteria bacterium]|nr:electron-transfer flavoprotein:ubiquinone oxidoreductase [Gammaproteobacteria bacterium]
MSRESLEFDVVIVGAGPAGLATAVRLTQLSAANDLELAIAVVEKGAEVGAHIVSGAVIEPHALAELLPDWRERGAPAGLEVSDERFHWLTSNERSFAVPRALLPRPLRNDGNRIVSLGRLCRWLAAEAEALGVDLLTGFAATELIVERQRVAGVLTGPHGIGADGTPKPGADPGYELRAKYVVLAEGCRGHLGQRAEREFGLRDGIDPQHYGIGFKEVWIVPEAHEAPGRVEHTAGWPLDDRTEGGGFVYHAGERRLSVGFVVALNYRNPHLDPFKEFQRWKTHPRIRSLLDGGERIGFGARAVNKGGLGSLPRLDFPGGLLVGCDAGFLNGAKIKGTHTAIKSGLLAAETIADALQADRGGGRALDGYGERVASSSLHGELYAARNFSAGIARFGVRIGGAVAFVEHNLLRGRAPWRIDHSTPDHAMLETVQQAEPIGYPAPDGKLTFDRLASIHLANIEHAEDQPVHLLLGDASVPIRQNLARYGEPAERYCPAGVYEIIAEPGGPRFQI